MPATITPRDTATMRVEEPPPRCDNCGSFPRAEPRVCAHCSRVEKPCECPPRFASVHSSQRMATWFECGRCSSLQPPTK